MAGDTVLITVAWKLIGEKNVAKAVKQMEKLPGIQKVTAKTGEVMRRKHRQIETTLSATGRVSQHVYKSHGKALENTTKKLAARQHAFGRTISFTATADNKLSSLNKTELQGAHALKGYSVQQHIAQESLNKAGASFIPLINKQKKLEEGIKTQFPLLRNQNLHMLAQRPIMMRLTHGYMLASNSLRKHRIQQNALVLTSGKLRRAAWSITWGAMSMLGVFFGGFAVLRMFTRAAEMLIRPLTDIGKMAETIAKAYAFGMMTGIGPFAAGILNLGDMMAKLPGAFIASQAVVLGFSALLGDLVIDMFSNEKVLSSLSTIFENFATLWGPIKNMLIGFVVGLLKVLNFITADSKALIHFIEILAGFVTTMIHAGLQLLFVGLRAAGAGGYVDSLAAGIASAEGPWEKLGAVVAAFTAVLVPASMSAMLFLPMLSVLQVGVLALSAVFWILGAALSIGTTLTGIFAGSSGGAASVLGVLAISLVLIIGLLGYFAYRFLSTEEGMQTAIGLMEDFKIILVKVADFMAGPGFDAFVRLATSISTVVGWLAELIKWYDRLPVKPMKWIEGTKLGSGLAAREEKAKEPGRVPTSVLGRLIGKELITLPPPKVKKEAPTGIKDIAKELNLGEFGSELHNILKIPEPASQDLGFGFTDLFDNLTPLSKELPGVTSDVDALGSSTSGAAGSLAKSFKTLQAAMASFGRSTKKVDRVSAGLGLPSVPVKTAVAVPSGGEGLIPGARDVSDISKEGYVPKKGDYSPVTSQTIYQSVSIGSIEKTADVEEVIDSLSKEEWTVYRLP